MREFASNAQAIAGLAESGSPIIVSSFGRLFGLGNSEQAAFARGELPRWAAFGLGAVAGAFVAVMLYRKAPTSFQKIAGS